MIKIRTEKEIRERLKKLKKQRATPRPFSEQKRIAWYTAKQALSGFLKK